MTNLVLGGPVIGIVGMGYSSIPNFLDLAFNAGQINTNVFSLQLKNMTSQSIVYYNVIPNDILN